MLKYRVSVLVTFYNQEEHVDKALESIIAQKTEFGVKIIVGDDGSSDRTCNIVREWIQRFPDRIELHVMDRDNGVKAPGFRASRNRINLLKFVDTDYYIFLDGDDYFCYEGKLQKQVDILDAEENSDCTACGHNVSMLFKDGKERPFTDPEPEEGKIESGRYWKKYHFHPDSLLFRSSVIPHIDTGLLINAFNDNMVTLPAILYGKIYYIPGCWAVYVQTNDGIWTSGENAVNLIRQILFYDLSCRIAPDMRNESLCKFGYAWNGLYKLRSSIDLTALEEYRAEAEDKQCRHAAKWLKYNETNLFGRLSVLFDVLKVRIATEILYRIR